jgi:hypothetical protein
MVLAAVLLAELAVAAEREVIQSDWQGFQQHVNQLHFRGRSARIRLHNGGEVKTELLEVNGDAMRVRLTRALRQWKSGEGVAEIPKDQVASVRFGGRMGHGGLIGGLAGLGAGAGIGAAVAMNTDCFEGVCVVLRPVAGVAFACIGSLIGYLVGRATGRPAPEFVLIQ